VFADAVVQFVEEFIEFGLGAQPWEVNVPDLRDDVLAGQRRDDDREDGHLGHPGRPELKVHVGDAGALHIPGAVIRVRTAERAGLDADEGPR
jgi:hypothetical protein